MTPTTMQDASSQVAAERKDPPGTATSRLKNVPRTHPRPLALERAILDAAENEQRRLAQTLHDTVCQSLGGVQFLAEVIAGKVRDQCPEAAREVAALGDVIRHALDELHDLAAWLQPPTHDAPGLIVALSELTRVTSNKIRCIFECPKRVAVADNYVALQLFQIAREVVYHAVHHSGARHLVIQLLPLDGELTLSLRHDGDELGAHTRQHPVTGLELLQHRANAIGARLTIDSDPGHGTTVTCSLRDA